MEAGTLALPPIQLSAFLAITRSLVSIGGFIGKPTPHLKPAQRKKLYWIGGVTAAEAVVMRILFTFTPT
ncbi:MAG: hypothetical protein AAFZ91_11130 [Pseudomonadota bacterium]